MLVLLFFFFLMIRRPPRSTRTDNTLSLHDALPICDAGNARDDDGGRQVDGQGFVPMVAGQGRSEEHTSELQSLMRISYAVFCLKKKTQNTPHLIADRHRSHATTDTTRGVDRKHQQYHTPHSQTPSDTVHPRM